MITPHQSRQLHWSWLPFAVLPLGPSGRSSRGELCPTHSFPQTLNHFHFQQSAPAVLALSVWAPLLGSQILLCLWQGEPEGPLQSSPWSVTNSMRDINMPAPSTLSGTTLCCDYSVSRAPCKIQPKSPSMELDLILYPRFISFPALSHFPTLTEIPGITS